MGDYDDPDYTSCCLKGLSSIERIYSPERETKLICIDPITSATAHRCDQYIATTPGNDGLMALAMCNRLIREDLIDKDYLKDMSTQSFLVRRDTKKHLRLTNWPSTPWKKPSGSVASPWRP